MKNNSMSFSTWCVRQCDISQTETLSLWKERNKVKMTMKPLTFWWRTFVRAHCLIGGNAAMFSHSDRVCVAGRQPTQTHRGWRRWRGDLGVIKLKAVDTNVRTQQCELMKTSWGYKFQCFPSHAKVTSTQKQLLEAYLLEGAGSHCIYVWWNNNWIKWRLHQICKCCDQPDMNTTGWQ